LAAVELDAEVLRVGIAAVPGGAACLFMCHGRILRPSAGDAGDFDFSVVLPMPHLLHVVLAAAEFDDAGLVRASVALDRARDLGAVDGRGTEGDLVAVAQHQDLAELDGGADLCVEQLDAQGLALHHAVLLAASNDDCVHGNLWICWLCSYVGAAAWRTASGIEPREKQPPWVPSGNGPAGSREG